MTLFFLMFAVDTALMQGVKKFFNMQKVIWPFQVDIFPLDECQM